MDIGLNSFQRLALIDLNEAGFIARPRGNWVEVQGGYRPEPIFTARGIDSYIAENVPIGME